MTLAFTLAGCVGTSSESVSSAYSSEPQSSSSHSENIVSSASSALSVSSESVVNSSAAPALTGADYYQEHCVSCHGDDGMGFGVDLTIIGQHFSDQQKLVQYNSEWMPKGAAQLCQGECARLVSDYIVDTFMAGNFGDMPSACDDVQPLPRRLRRLSNWEYKLTTDMLLGLNAGDWQRLPTENRVHGFDNNADETLISSTFVDAYLDVATTLSNRLNNANKFANFMSNYGACHQGNACADMLVRQFLPLAFRRPITPQEFTRYRELFASTDAEGFVEGARALVVSALNSPHFLYRTELGQLQANGNYKLTPYEVASWMSFTFLGRGPDQRIYDSAVNGAFNTANTSRNRINGFLGNNRIQPTLGRFGQMWLQVDDFDAIGEKDTGIFTAYTPQVGRSMIAEVDQYFRHILFDTDATLADLYGANFTLANNTLVDFYNLDAPDVAEGFTKVPTANRFGWLTMGASLASHADATDTNPIGRGIFVRTELLCHDLPPVPRNIDIIVPERDTELSARESFAEHSKAGECASCHYLIDDLGFALEQFNGAGNFRLRENGRMIDVAQLHVNDAEGLGSAITETVNGPADLASFLTESEDAKRCVARQFTRYAQGIKHVDRCSTNTLVERLSANNGNLLEMMLDITHTPQFMYRHDSVAP